MISKIGWKKITGRRKLIKGRLKEPDMKHRFVCSRTPRIAGAGLVAAALVFMAAFRGAQATDGQSAAATWSEGVLHVTIPYRGLQAGSGQLRIEVLDPEDINILAG